MDLFEKANASIKRFSLSNKKPRDYLLRGKVFCGCCDHAMSLRNGAWFYCRHSEVAETLPCHGVRIKMADLEQVVFETIRAQMCPALGIDSNKDKLDLQTVQQAEHEEKLRSIQDSKRHLYEQYALGEIDLETYRTRKAVYDTELVQAKNVHAVITAQTKQIKSDYEIKLKQQEIVQEVGNANMLTKALIDRLINKVYVFPGDRISVYYGKEIIYPWKAAMQQYELCFRIIFYHIVQLQYIRIYDLPHPYVKPTTKKFITFFEVFRAAS